MSEMLKVTCAQCGVPFEFIKGKGRPFKYCSDECKKLVVAIRNKSNYDKKKEAKEKNNAVQEAAAIEAATNLSESIGVTPNDEVPF